jgi:hypothetical protein
MKQSEKAAPEYRWHKSGFERAAKVSLTPGFSRVWPHAVRENRLNGFRWPRPLLLQNTPEKPLKRLSPETWPHRRAEARC